MGDERKDSRQDDRPGDVLGIGDVPPTPGRQRRTRRRRAEGIDVREPATGIGDLTQGKGATGIDMGATGGGTDIAPPDRSDTEE